jgi:glycosyltransferase involved in cell wall biosynthesis
VSRLKISVVVPSSNQREFLTETLGSLANQDYRPLEVLIQDAGSKDDSIQIGQDFVQRFPEVFQLFVEKDNGEGHRLNRGFARATGEILGFINPGDTLLPGCLSRVVREVSPQNNRYVVMGRCAFHGDGGPYGGIEHPCEYVDHFHLLAIWMRGVNTIPQPSVFWHRSTWEKCGGFHSNRQQVLDYEIFIRFSKFYRFHRVDDFWASRRIGSARKHFAKSETDLWLKTSRAHWGPWWSLLRWRCEISFWLHRPRAFENARYHARLAEDGFHQKALWKTLQHATATSLYSPKLAWNRLAVYFLQNVLFPIGEAMLLRPIPPPKKVTTRYGDNWIGPSFVEKIQVPIDASLLVLSLQFVRPRAIKTRIDFLVEGRKLRSLTRKTSETLDVNLGVEPYRGKTVSLQILSSTCFTPHYYSGNNDQRLLSLKIQDLRFD